MLFEPAMVMPGLLTEVVEACGAGVCGAPPHPHGTFPHDVVIATAATRMMYLIFTMRLLGVCGLWAAAAFLQMLLTNRTISHSGPTTMLTTIPMRHTPPTIVSVVSRHLPNSFGPPSHPITMARPQSRSKSTPQTAQGMSA